MADALRAGVVWANTFNKFDPTSPFGGYKESGYGREGGRHGLEGYLRVDVSRIDVRKTYKLFIGGEFPRSESGHSYVVNDARGRFVANAALASRKDARDAVVAARKAFPGWSGRTAYNRGQVLYRVAEVMEDRRPQFVDAVRQGEGGTAASGRRGRRRRHRPAGLVRRLGRQGHPGGRQRQPGGRPVLQPLDARADRRGRRAGARRRRVLLGLVSVLAPVIVTGNTAVVAAVPERPLPAVTFAEVLATSDVPGGVVNLLTGALADTVAPGWPRTWTSTRST